MERALEDLTARPVRHAGCTALKVNAVQSEHWTARGLRCKGTTKSNYPGARAHACVLTLFPVSGVFSVHLFSVRRTRTQKRTNVFKNRSAAAQCVHTIHICLCVYRTYTCTRASSPGAFKIFITTHPAAVAVLLRGGPRKTRRARGGYVRTCAIRLVCPARRPPAAYDLRLADVSIFLFPRVHTHRRETTMVRARQHTCTTSMCCVRYVLPATNRYFTFDARCFAPCPSRSDAFLTERQCVIIGPKWGSATAPLLETRLGRFWNHLINQSVARVQIRTILFIWLLDTRW